MLNDLTIEFLANEFWKNYGDDRKFPRPIERAVVRTLPIAIVKIPHLWVSNIYEYASRNGLPTLNSGTDRPLRGCLLAFRGRALLFLDGVDSESDWRFSIAHEIAHFLCDYLHPRLRAIETLGEAIAEVLDGDRQANVDERIDAILGQCHIGVHAHYMYRGQCGVVSIDIDEAESVADRLALELLAPDSVLNPRITVLLKNKADGNLPKTIERLLVHDFGLPAAVAKSHSRTLAAKSYGQFKVRRWLQ